ncbi:MAG: hypothetical protein B7C24_09475 [Bacteroidetes bacterium 4572_77]|nr:MAG: hypothetical protein B7C24_09475 [Bacteroidetes bacterium 4572_77]
MKNKNLFFYPIIIIASLFITTQQTKAQQKPFKFGFKLAPAISWLSPDSKHYENDGNAFTFAWGFVADITLMEHYYVNTGFNVSYFQANLKYDHQNQDTIASKGIMHRTYNLRYIEVPITFKMKTNELVDKFKFFGLIGINTGINIRAKADEYFKNSSTYGYQDDNIDIKDETALFKASLIVGAGAEYVIDESLSLIIGINFNNGFTNVLKGNNTAYPDIEAKAIPYYFELNLGVIF